MSDSAKGISVACTADEVFVRVVGRGTFQNSQPLRRFVLEMIEKNYRRFTVDVGACPNMDSTFLGVLAGIGLRLRQDGKPDARIRIVRVSPRNVELLQTLGLDRLFTICAAGEQTTEPFWPSGVAVERLADTDVEALSKPLDKNETTDLMLDAHDNLIRADQRNVPRFSSVTKFLRESLDRRQHEKK
jgi:anti-anti-sigma factor